jgi:hypothetical protein
MTPNHDLRRFRTAWRPIDQWPCPHIRQFKAMDSLQSIGWIFKMVPLTRGELHLTMTKRKDIHKIILLSLDTTVAISTTRIRTNHAMIFTGLTAPTEVHTQTWNIRASQRPCRNPAISIWSAKMLIHEANEGEAIYQSLSQIYFEHGFTNTSIIHTQPKKTSSNSCSALG